MPWLATEIIKDTMIKKNTQLEIVLGFYIVVQKPLKD